MFYFIGLQNPRNEFKTTRHNIGGEFVEWLYEQSNVIQPWTIKKNLKTAIIKIENHEITLLIPQVYINNSGEIYWFFKDKRKNDYIQKTFCIVDDLETDFEKIKLKTHENKSSKGHNGLKSIKNYFGDIPHVLALGIGRPEKNAIKSYEDISDFVLGNFSSFEQKKILSIFENSYEILIDYICKSN